MADAYGDANPAPVEPVDTVERLRCSYCQKLLAELVTGPFRLVCGRCHTVNTEGSIPTI